MGIVPFGGIVDALQKINYLAYSTQKLTNETSDAFHLVNDELCALREVVLDNRKVTDLLISENGGSSNPSRRLNFCLNFVIY